MMRVVPHSELALANLIVDALYERSVDGHLAEEPISRLLPGSGNIGGLTRRSRKTDSDSVYFCAEHCRDIDRQWF